MTVDDVVACVSLEEVTNSDADLSSVIAKGFGNGPDCLGIIIIKDLDPAFIEMRKRLLTLASKVADLDDEAKLAVTHPQSSYSFGWSHGKEIMEEGKPDFAKGSYYNNPVTDVTDDPSFTKNYPTYGFPNVWPTELPELKEAFMQLGTYIVEVGIMLARHCDRYISAKYPDLPRDLIAKPLSESVKTHKARLLHYFALSEEEAKASAGKMGSWCGLHIDHSMLTGLTSAMYIDTDDKSYTELDTASPSVSSGLQSAGLYIKSRGDQLTKVKIPRDCLAFQIGEASQVASRGLLVATPHLVRGGAAPNVVRNTFAVFIQPDVEHRLTPTQTFQGLTEEVMKRHY